ncbi:MAG: restriction endonuclease [Desulfobacterales bacterium]|nr:restriction endonuclease [Desulfobacterales bacterium]
MSIARHHIEWIQLIEISGPFLSLPVLMRIFPQGLEKHDSEHFRSLKAAFEEWQDNQQGLSPDPDIHREWVRFVITETLEWGEKQLEEDLLTKGRDLPSDLLALMCENDTAVPDFALMNPDGMGMPGKPRILISVLPTDHDLEKSRQESMSPAERMMQVLRCCDVRTGLLTNGEKWMLIYAPREGTVSYITWHAPIWFEEHITLRAFRSLLSSVRFIGVSEKETLEALFTESAENQQDVTDQLGFQVRKAVEVLIRALDREGKNFDTSLLTDTDEKEIYDAALTIMMRLVFLLSAEERKLLLSGESLYDQYYSVSTLREQLQKEADQHGEEVLEYRNDAWYRLLATFRAVYGGMNHDLLHLPAYGGRLFDPDRYPFLEGRELGTSWKDTLATPLPVNNRTVLHLLSALQILQEKVPGGGQTEARRLSFRALGVEQIGYVYEGLLDHTAVRAKEPVLGLRGTKGRDEDVPLSELERLREKGEEELVKFLKKQTGRVAGAIRRAITELPVIDEQRLLVACDNDQGLKERVMPFAGLLQEDTSGYPVVVTENSIYVTQGTDRRTSGTHYTPPELTEPIVKHTLDPLVYDGVSEGKPGKEWKLRTAKEILSLKICDMAMGSGAFLVQGTRYLARCLVKALDEIEKNAEGRFVTSPEGDLSKNSGVEEYPIPKDSDERYSFALRVISEQCIYGVDKNPMAVEMAKLSLWLETMAKNRPFTFLDHALKCGDSLLGVDRVQLKNWSATDKGGGFRPMQKEINEAIAFRKALEQVRTLDIRDVERKEHLHRKAEAKIGRLKLAGDMIVAPYLMEGTKKAQEEKRVEFFSWFSAFKNTEIEGTLRQKADELLGDHCPFHWPLEFPEIFMDDHRREGFDAIIGNPPFQGGQKITGALGTPYRNYLVGYIAGGKKGSADLCAYFYLRATELMRDKGIFGLLATNTIAQGDSREVGLDQIANNGGSIIRALPSMKWPGTANLEVAVAWLRKGQWEGAYTLGDKPVEGITPFLAKPGVVAGNPYRLKANEDKSFIGSYGDH